MLTAGGHKQLRATHVQLWQSWPRPDNPVSQSSRAALASARRSRTRSHTRHFAPQITPRKSVHRAGQGRFCRGDQAAGSDSYHDCRTTLQKQPGCRHGATLSLAVRRAIKARFSNGKGSASKKAPSSAVFLWLCTEAFQAWYNCQGLGSGGSGEALGI